MKRTMWVLALSGLMCGILPIPGEAAMINVPGDQPTIQEGIDIAGPGDTVLVHPGVYPENINFDGNLVVVASLFITTGDTSYISQTVIDGGQNGSVVTFESGEGVTSVLNGFTVTNGMGQGLPTFTGGGITCRNTSAPFLTNLNITENATSSNFGRGGGMYCGGYSSPTLSNVRIWRNSAESGGGGIYLDDNSSPNLNNVMISENTSNSAGGGLYCNASSNPYLFRVTIADNSASGSGGGIYCGNSDPILVHVTMADNSSIDEGGGIFCDGSHPVSVNSILWSNQPDQVFLFPDPVPSSFTSVYSDVGDGWPGMGNIDQDPLFEDAAGGFFNLTEESPCVDSGIPFFVLEGDTLINLAPGEYVGPAPDMGAFEFGIAAGVDEPLPVPDTFTLSQNYPNPFNPLTVISYSIANSDVVVLTVYDILGREIRTLVDEFQKPNTYWVYFDASSLSGGIYFYRLRAGENFADTKKMILVR